MKTKEHPLARLARVLTKMANEAHRKADAYRDANGPLRRPEVEARARGNAYEDAAKVAREMLQEVTRKEKSG